MKGALRKIRLSRTELIILLLFLLLNLRVLNWFEPGYLIFGGDLRPPVAPNVFLQNALNAWNQVDWGVPSVYSPRMLDPFLSLMTGFQSIGLSAYNAEILAVYLIYVFVSILMYAYVKRLTNGDILAAFMGAIFFISNAHLIVDREQTAVGFVDMSLMILPSLLTFTEGLRRKSLQFMALSGFLFILTYASFPNYRAPVLCIIAMLVTLGSMYLNRTSRISNTLCDKAKSWRLTFDWNIARRYSKYIAVFAVAVAFASVWLVTLIYANLGTFLSAFGQAGAPMSATFGNRAPDVLRLIAEWSFYDQYAGFPYVPYAANYFTNPLLFVLSYVPTILAFGALFVSKTRRRTVFFAVLAALFLILTMGSSPLFAPLYNSFLDFVPIIRAFRTSTNWIFLVLFTFSVLIGLFSSGTWRIIRRKSFKVVTIIAVIAVLFYTSYPLWTGEVTNNWMEDPNYQTVHHGGYIPPYYYDLDSVLPNQYWTLLMPQRNVYVIYNFTGKGVLAVGNPYPLVISKPFLSTSATEYVQSSSRNLLIQAYGIALNGHGNIVPEGNITASSYEVIHDPKNAVDGDYNSRWTSTTGLPQWIEIDWSQNQQLTSLGIVFESKSAFAEEYSIQTWTGSIWNTQFNETNNENSNPIYTFSPPVDTTKLRIEFTKASNWNQSSVLEIEFNPNEYINQTDLAPKFLGMLGVKDILIEDNIIAGSYSKSQDNVIQNGTRFSLVKTWDEASLYENSYAQPIVYAATNVMSISDAAEMRSIINNSTWSTLQKSVLVSSADTSQNWTMLGTMQMPQNLSWKEISPTKYEVTAQVNGPFALAFLENYDSHWKATVNGQPISESSHFKVNSFGNGWLIDGNGKLEIILEFKTQDVLAVSFIASIVLCAFLVVALVSRKSIRKICSKILKTITFKQA